MKKVQALAEIWLQSLLECLESHMHSLNVKKVGGDSENWIFLALKFVVGEYCTLP